MTGAAVPDPGGEVVEVDAPLHGVGVDRLEPGVARHVGVGVVVGARHQDLAAGAVLAGDHPQHEVERLGSAVGDDEAVGGRVGVLAGQRPAQLHHPLDQPVLEVAVVGQNVVGLGRRGQVRLPRSE